MNEVQKTKRKKLSKEAIIASSLVTVLIVLSLITAVRHSGLFKSSSPTQENQQSISMLGTTYDGIEPSTNTEQPAQTPVTEVTDPTEPEQKTEEKPTEAEPTQPETTEESKEITETPKEETPNQPGTTNDTDNVYSFTASRGDSYTKFARTAIADYVTQNKLTISPTDSLRAEVTLTNNAGAPMLEIGQEVNISKDDISAVVANKTASVEPTDTNNASTEKNNESQDNTQNTSNSDKIGDYTAQAEKGDSYTIIARRAIQQVVEQRQTQLSDAQKLAAETFLASNAGFPLLEVGQTVTILTTDIVSAIERASALSQDQQNVWLAYINS